MNRILAVDPGKTTGWALLEWDGKLIDMGQVNERQVYPWIDSLKDIRLILVENFRIRPGVNFSWSEMFTIRVIGALEFRAHQLGCNFTTQEPHHYPVGLKWAGVELPKNHNISHQIVAYAHGTYYSVHFLKNKPPALEKMKNVKEPK